LKTLLLGAGRRKNKMIWKEGDTQEFKGKVIRLDINKDVEPNIIWDLNNHPLPFKDREFDEIHAYHILEHLAHQGDWRFFFNEWNEYYRILKPNGLFIGVVPTPYSKWAWGDPGHTRLFPKEYFTFLDQDSYKLIDKNNPLTDYRFIYKGDFKLDFLDETDRINMAFILVRI